jgi:hypothetical protein
MKLLQEPIEVRIDAGRLQALRWRGRVYAVQQISERWRYRGRWWADPTMRGEIRTYFRVRCAPLRGASAGGDFEIYESGGRWTLSRVLD